MLNYKIEDSKI